MEIIKLGINDIKPYKGNAKKHPKEQIEQIKKSILAFGMNDPIAIDENNTVIEGHGRLLALKELEYKEVECIRLSHLTLEQKRAYILAHNKLTLNTGFDVEILKVELDFLKGAELDIALTGFDAAALAELFGEPKATVKEDDDFDLTPPPNTICRLGDLFLLGNNRLLIGDSTDFDTVKRLMNGEKAQMIFTDLPWNIDYGSDTKHPCWKPRQILNDKMTPEAFKQFLHTAFSVMKEVVIPGCMVYSIMGMASWSLMDIVLRDLGYHYSDCITWGKDTPVLSRADYHRQTEMIWYGWLEGAPRRCPLLDRKQSNLWSIPRPKRSDQHPMSKPLELVARALQNSSRENDLVIDFFAGSGSCLMAAVQKGRRCNSMELSPHYAELIVRRYVNMFGSNAVVLIREGKTVAYKDFIKE